MRRFNGENLRDAILVRWDNLSSFCEAKGYRNQTISEYVNGKVPSVDTLCKLADDIGCTSDFLLGEPFHLEIPICDEVCSDVWEEQVKSMMIEADNAKRNN